MNMTLTDYKHIQLDNRGVAIIEGSTMKVIDLVMSQIAYGWTPEEIQINHRNLSMSQIHSALAYYWDHKNELDKAIQAEIELVKKLRENQSETPFVSRLKREGLLP